MSTSSAGGGARRHRSILRGLAFGLLVPVLALVLAACRLNPPEVILYGDSLATQSWNYFNFFEHLGATSTTVNNTYPGTAPCNMLAQMESDAAGGYMTVAVIEYSGNNFGCMDYPAGSPAFFTAYQQQVTQAATDFSNAGVHTFLIGYPMSIGDVTNDVTTWDQLNQIYATIAATVPNTTFVNAGASVEEGQQFAWTLPCLVFEASCGAGNVNIVRAPDGTHFCPQPPTDDWYDCPAWDSGAMRYGMTMASAVDTFLNTGSAPEYEGPPLPPAGTPPAVAPGQVSPYTQVQESLTTGQELTTGQSIQSLNGQYSAVMQPDGNFVVYGPGHVAVWATGTAGTNANQLIMQTDGNLVLYNASGVALWASNTWGTGADYLGLGYDGSLDLYGAALLWSTPAAGA